MSISLAEHMQAVHLDAYGGPVSVRQSPVPKPVPGQVLVRMAASPINPSDLAFLRGTYRHRKPLPAIPGIEGSGTVVAIGPGLYPRLLLGRRVACSVLPTTGGGTWADYMVTSARLCVPLQKHITLEQGAMMLVNPLTALAFIEIARRGKHAAIVNTAAAGALGRMVVRLGHQNRIPVVSIVRRKEHVDVIHAEGGSYALDSSQPDFLAQLRTLTHGLNATLLLDAVAGNLTNQLLEAAPSGSTVLVYGSLSAEACRLDPRGLVNDDKHVAGFHLATWLARKSPLQVLQITREAQRLLGTGLRTVVQQRLPLSSAPQAVDLSQGASGAGKVLLVMDPHEVRVDS